MSFLNAWTTSAVLLSYCMPTEVPLWSSNGKQWRETDFYWHKAVRMETAPLFISNFSPQIGICHWALQCLKHHFPNLWCGKHDLIPVQCFSSDSPSLQIVFQWHHFEGVIVHHCGWRSAASSGKAGGEITAEYQGEKKEITMKCNCKEKSYSLIWHSSFYTNVNSGLFFCESDCNCKNRLMFRAISHCKLI